MASATPRVASNRRSQISTSPRSHGEAAIPLAVAQDLSSFSFFQQSRCVSHFLYIDLAAEDVTASARSAQSRSSKSDWS